MDKKLISEVLDYKALAIKTLIPVSYTVKNSGKKEIGFVAQQVKGVEPRIVGTAANGLLNIDYEQLSVILFSYVQQLEVRIEILESKTKVKK
jgi:hypothetical protein